MSIKKNIIHGIKWGLVTRVIGSLSGIITLAITARLLTPEDFAVMALAFIFVSLSLEISQSLLSQSLIVRNDIMDEHIRVALSYSALVGIFLMSFFIFWSVNIANFFDNPLLADVIVVVSIIVPLSAVYSIPYALMRKRLDFKVLGYIDVSTNVVGYSLVTIVLANYGWGVWSLVIGRVCQSILMALSLFVFFKMPLKPLWKLCYLRDLLHFGGGQTIATLSAFVSNNVDKVILGRFIGDIELGLYDRARRLRELPVKFIAATLGHVLFPVLSPLKKNKDEISRILNRSIFLISSISLPLTIFLFVYSDEVIHIVLGEQWGDASPIFQIVILILFVRMTARIFNVVAFSLGAAYSVAIRELLLAISIVFGAMVGVLWGVKEVALAVVLAHIFYFIFVLYSTKRLVGIKYSDLMKSSRTGFILSVLFGVTWFLTEIFSPTNLNSIILMLCNIVIMLAATVLLLRFSPYAWLTKYEQWFIDQRRIRKLLFRFN